MSELKNVARQALTDKKAEFIIGFSEDRNKHIKPFIARTPEDADKMIFNHYAVNNLASYLTRFKNKVNGKIGIVVKNCDLKAVTALIQENQFKRDDLFIIGVNCSGVVREVNEEWSRENTQIKCKYCQQRTPSYYDELAGELEEMPVTDDDQLELMNKLEAMSSSERWDFWAAEFDKCMKCYACRQVCPMCYCEQCIAEKSMPQWIESSSTARGNFAWNVIRAFHMAGRCIGCHECERACPADIPLTLLTRKMGMTAFAEFGYRHGTAIDQPTLIGNYNTSDKQEFIK
jgi:formate dehydrogenase subunit beta